MNTTTYTDSFIAVASDCPATHGDTPSKPISIAAIQLEKQVAGMRSRRA